jgi:hypothetical protein
MSQQGNHIKKFTTSIVLIPVWWNGRHTRLLIEKRKLTVGSEPTSGAKINITCETRLLRQRLGKISQRSP